ncbi:MAG: hypothetical protein JXR73_09645 [Candidatus Omnitrophica bacterium]|nr:hypothetical protein [Candidatus Omnitrophota bacterium]
MFFSSSVLEETTDDYGNVYVTSPSDGVIPFPENFGGDADLVLEGLIVDPTYIYETYSDDDGNSYTTTAADDALAPEAVFTTDNLVDDNLWVLRGGAMPDMGVLASRAPAGTEDAPMLQTTVTMGAGGTYNVYFLYGDIGEANESDDQANPTPIDAGIEGQEMKTYFQADGQLITDEYGWNILEVSLGSVTLAAGESFKVLIDDHVGEGARSAYLGLRISEGGPFTPPERETFDFNLDNKWMIYPVAGRELLLSHGPGSGEDAPQLTTEITVAHAGTYEVIFHFMDSNDNPDQGWILASLNDGEVQEYGAGHPDAVRATGGTSPAYPWIDGTTISSMFWYTAVMGEIELAAGESIQIAIDDYQFSSGLEYMASVFEGVTLHVIEGGPPITDIMVSTEFRYEWGVDGQGNQYMTIAADESLTEDQVFTSTDSNSDGLWRLRSPNMGPYGYIYSGMGPTGEEDCPMLKTIVEIAQGGMYEVYMYMGDVGQVGTDDEDNPQPIKAGFDPDNLTTYLQADGEFIGLYGFNVLQVSLGTVEVEDGGRLEVYIDDAEEVEGGDRRSNYGGLLLVKKEDTSLDNWHLY